ncbi:transglycosylase family protein [uncultured Friedmanniella sp.]|uniref:LysM peptidoglycan-binding domain-containing protein n=1 Tax=uncultured Friedmanniella sp. TaxID=335381 RepID=UPI0035CB2CD4
MVGIFAAVALAVGISAAGAAPASAKTVWDKVASCESGGRWKINTGNGYYGGLQFASRTWKGYGGGKYAGKANHASKPEQIAIARRVLAGQGAGAWASCGRRAHLTKSNGKANKHATPSTNPGAKKKAVKKKTVSWTKKAASGSKHQAGTARVRQGDTLAKIARRYSVKGGWKGLWKMNKKSVPDPNRISIGEVLKIA